MRVLVLNSGSSSLKFRVLNITPATNGRAANHRVLAGGAVTGIGGLSTFRLDGNSDQTAAERPVKDHGEAVEWIFSHLDTRQIGAVGHRVVHGGERFGGPVRLTDAVLAEIEQLSDLAPLHNPACLAAIRGAREHLPDDTPMVAVFDTSFHATMPTIASTYAIPNELAARHGIRRYGFHGIAHQSLMNGYAALTGRDLSNARLITLHLGNGCSAAAIRGGRSVDTSMGLTPLEGLVMGTRSGDLDPAIVAYLARRERVDAQTIERWLNEKSGLLGVTGLSNDMRKLLEAEAEGNHRAALAIDLFCYRARKYIGAYLAVLEGADAVVFGGGIGEHSPVVRERICAGMEWCGLKLDREQNRKAVNLVTDQAARISPKDAAVPAFVVAVDEETAIADETVQCLENSAEL